MTNPDPDAVGADDLIAWVNQHLDPPNSLTPWQEEVIRGTWPCASAAPAVDQRQPLATVPHP